MDRDLILVTFNYRIGALGFLSTGDEVVPGNNGLRDQTLVLHWVQNNIESFNGNPKSVTLTGFSAGAASLHLHYLTPHSKGLFHRGISLSGSALNPWTIRLNPLENAKRLAKSVGCDMDDTKKMVMCLKTRPASQLVEHTEGLHDFGGMPFCLFPPVVDKHAKKPFLEDLPENLLKAGRVLDVPWMVSYTKEDGLIASLVVMHLIKKLNEQWNEVGHYILQTDDAPHSAQQEALRKVKERYASSGEDMTFEDLTKLETDVLLGVGIERSIQLHAAAVKSPVYFNRFGYSGQNSFKALLGAEDIEGVCHGDDMVYFFGGMIFKALSDNDIKMKDVCLDILYTFAHSGKPKALDKEWEPTSEKLKYHVIDNPERIEVKIKTDYSDHKFWKQMKILEKSHLLSHVKDEL
ncbi:unnamed protein product [Acanthoscelides obtectus]|uniref:Carboxylesterase type B domain-containing protein n=1 Tax=Acanthoscelides obtectus TaxID=200917 RepID=A0A9P0LRV0_ACAOB|nr:unnamed protein product [Acanthoscelides obtectus]CAK1654646.1 hypothetical protein AOBTE_LOCUS18738 [Acanthoscelides obtectus]